MHLSQFVMQAILKMINENSTVKFILLQNFISTENLTLSEIIDKYSVMFTNLHFNLYPGTQINDKKEDLEDISHLTNDLTIAKRGAKFEEVTDLLFKDVFSQLESIKIKWKNPFKARQDSFEFRNISKEEEDINMSLEIEEQKNETFGQEEKGNYAKMSTTFGTECGIECFEIATILQKSHNLEKVWLKVAKQKECLSKQTDIHKMVQVVTWLDLKKKSSAATKPPILSINNLTQLLCNKLVKKN
eukprot:UN11675